MCVGPSRDTTLAWRDGNNKRDRNNAIAMIKKAKHWEYGSRRQSGKVCIKRYWDSMSKER